MSIIYYCYEISTKIKKLLCDRDGKEEKNFQHNIQMTHVMHA